MKRFWPNLLTLASFCYNVMMKCLFAFWFAAIKMGPPAVTCISYAPAGSMADPPGTGLLSWDDLDDASAEGSLDRLIEGLTRYSEKQWVQMQALEGGWQKIYGPVLVFRQLWEQLGLDKLLTDLQAKTAVQFSIDEAVFAMVLHRLLDPGSKRATHQWLETVYRPQFETLEVTASLPGFGPSALW